MTNTEFEVMRKAQKKEQNIAIMRALDSLKTELNTANHGSYDFHKYTDEYGMVITVNDVMSVIDRYIREYEE